MISKKNTVLTTTGVVTFASLLLGTLPAFAETETGGNEVKPPVTIQSPVHSEAEISFEQNETEVTPPVGPGGEEIEKPGEGETGMVGPLTIDYITKLNFGAVKVSGNTTTYHAKLAELKLKDIVEPKKVPNYVQVTDNRGTNAGWQLQLKQDTQFQAKDANNKVTELTGAQLTLDNPTLKSTQKGSEFAPLGIKQKLTPGAAAVTVVNAAAGKGMGTWHYSLGDTNEQAEKSVSLTIPGDTAKLANVAYKTVLTWTLVDAPEKSEVTPEVTP
ncbi:hypothetical protein UAW_01033 [Enterococcus haemoperoxidus ATCC BAA-382]|uniref:WxL domain-containing protein n=1 Tax=Enterococcus haemoperoxidus ATCC BAA-382 TaxID=1158608 RepID=R2T222_9ENTE|nr:WxL domain-containing protein [Enterococcus haemoperoxidus]EOH99076.1 hypothetical protein UAW_01033 [Enterococcus haemoperoxidus ATCC BAA-382]EOT62379.1 hypothetical protein I583_01379 [Enterococcus haemoperoxidus ATCC BAA-382]OJG49103.1 hypothetical protein RV06_GL002029 [Enterococcus haemoperoxidus]